MSDRGSPGFPNGWFAVAFSKDLGVGDVQRIRYFDNEMVLFRTRSGKARVLDAYCPHIGAHLGEGGRVQGESIRCPFHAWEFDGESGACSRIPYCARIPAKARVHAWETRELNHMIYVWHHAEGKAPDWEVPQIPYYDDADWSPARTFEITVPVHMQDMAENNLDPVHFQYVHGMASTPDTEISFEDDGRVMHAVSYSTQDTPVGQFEMELVRDTYCLGLGSVESRGIPGVGLYMWTSTSPIDRDHTISRWVLTTTNNAVDVAGEEWMDNITKGVFDDMRIWTHKIHRAEPVFCEADTLLAEFRRWARQFYSTDQLA